MRGFESLPAKAAWGALAITTAAGALGYNQLRDGEEDEKRLDIPENTTEEVCAADGLSPDAYLEAIGLGPYRTNEVYDKNESDRNAIVTEVVEDIKGNTMGIALLSEAVKQQSSDYTVEQFLSRVVNTYEELEANDDRRQEVCESVVGSLQTATLEDIKAPTLLEVTNQYEDDSLTGVQGTEVSSQATHPVVSVKDENGAVRFGIALQKDRDGKFLLILNNGETTGDAGENEDDGTTATTIAKIGGGTATEQAEQDGGGPSGSDGGGETTGGAPGGDGPGCDGVGTGCEGEGPGGPGGPGGEDKGPAPTTTTTTTTKPPQTTTTTQPPQTTTTTRPPQTTTTTSTTQPEKPPKDNCDPVIDVCN